MIRIPSKFIQKNWLVILVAVIAFRFILIEIATYVVYQLAWYVTDSSAGAYYIGEPYGYELINWDSNLKRVTYGLYGLAFCIEVICIHIILKFKAKHFKAISPIASIAFLLSFPTFTSWSIEIPCERVNIFGFGCSRSIELIAPIIMSNNPVYIIISGAISLIGIKLYAKYFQYYLTHENNS